MLFPAAPATLPVTGLEDVKQELRETVQYPVQYAEKFEARSRTRIVPSLSPASLLLPWLARRDHLIHGSTLA